MNRSRYRRHFLLALAVLLLPSVVIAILGWLIVNKQSATGQQQADNIEIRTIASIAKAIEAKLQNIRVNEMAADPMWKGKFSSPSVALVGSVDRNRLILPWEEEEDDPNVAQSRRDFSNGTDFANKFKDADHADASGHDEQALMLSRSLLKTARNPTQRAYALLLLGGVLVRNGSQVEAAGIYEELLKSPSTIVDADRFGIPFAYYAAEKLAETHEADQDVFNRVEPDVRPESPILRPGSASHLWNILGLLEKSDDTDVREGAAAALKQLASYRRFIDQAEKLQDDFPNLQLTENEWKWRPDAAWLVGTAPSGPKLRQLVIAVRADEIYRLVNLDRRKVSDSNTQFDISDVQKANNQPLAAMFPGLRISLEAPNDLKIQQDQYRYTVILYAMSLALGVGLTLVGSSLLWRTTSREMRLAELRSQFVSSVSHELKTPLTSIRMFAEVLQMRGAADPQLLSDYLETIVNESERLTRLLNNVLDFSRIERGQKTYRLEPTQLREVVHAAARTMRHPLAEQGFVLGLSVSEGLAPVAADRDAIHQAILNLITNAMKYSTKRRDIELRLYSQGGHAVIEVGDHGIGISEKEQQRIFERFYRVPIPENGAISGTGLGLSLVAHIADAHGGSVQVTSKPGEGSTFSVRLPLLIAEPTVEPEGATPLNSLARLNRLREGPPAPISKAGGA